MRYNAKYDRWVSKDGLVYRYDKKNDKLVLCGLHKANDGYVQVNVSKPKYTQVGVHRLVYETFNDKIPQGYQIDHINTIRDDNRLENLRCVTPKENSNNPLTIKHLRESNKGINKGNTFIRCKTFSDFGDKFKEHFGITNYENSKLYHKEYRWYKRHNDVCRWEAEDKCKS